MLTCRVGGWESVCETSLTAVPAGRGAAFNLHFNLCPPCISATHSPLLNLLFFFSFLLLFIHVRVKGECHWIIFKAWHDLCVLDNIQAEKLVISVSDLWPEVIRWSWLLCSKHLMSFWIRGKASRFVKNLLLWCSVHWSVKLKIRWLVCH